MRFAVLLLCAICVGAQPPISLNARVALLQRLWNTAANPSGVTFEDARTLRREHILWLIRDHPEHPVHASPETRIDPEAGPLADAQGFLEAAALWKEAAAKPHAPVAIVAHAAYFLGVSERLAAFAILDSAWKTHPTDPLVAKVRGTLDAFEALGVKGATGPNEYVLDSVLATSSRAAEARIELESAEIATLAGNAGQVIATLVFSRNPPRDDVLRLGERLLKRAAQLDPAAPGWTAALTDYYMARGARGREPSDRIRWYREALPLATLDQQRMFLLGMIAEAELDAGENAAAEKDAAMVLTLSAPRTAASGYWDAIHKAHTLLGRVAMKRGDLSAAKKSLLASAQVEFTPALRLGGPSLRLAQELLDAGERDIVIEYLELSRTFWTQNQGKLDAFVKALKTDPSAMLLTPAERGPSLAIGTRPPPFKLKDLTGKEWPLTALLGKVVALDFWATWCQPCREEMPALNKVAKELAARGVVVLAIDAYEPEETLRGWIDQNPQSIPVLLGDEAVIRSYLVSIYPTLVIIDRKGVIAGVSTGRLSENELRKAIEKGFRTQ